MLTDAVVAIAMTLLVIPLVEAVPDVNGDDVGGFVSSHLSLFVGFVVSFLVILLFWSTHQRVFRRVEHMTPALRSLNGLWLLTIAFVPFPTALVGAGPTKSTTPVYIGTILVLAVLSGAMSEVAARNGANAVDSRYLRRRAAVSWAAAAVLGVCTVVSAFQPDLGLLLLMLIAGVRLVGDRWSDAIVTQA